MSITQIETERATERVLRLAGNRGRRPVTRLLPTGTEGTVRSPRTVYYLCGRCHIILGSLIAPETVIECGNCGAYNEL